MNDIYANIIGVLLGVLFFIAIFMFMALIIYVKKGFVKVFKNIDLVIKRINSFLESSNKEK